MATVLEDTGNLPEKKWIVRERDFTAIDPAIQFLTCQCEKPGCSVRRLRPLRDHMAVLLRAIVSCGMEETLPGYARPDEPWPGVIYALQMAASIEDVFADPSIIDDSETSFWCGDAWDQEEIDREAASKYVAALTIFNFVWLAYEAAIEEAAGTKFSKDKIPVRGRKLLDEVKTRVDSLPELSFLLRAARHFCKEAGKLEKDIAAADGIYGLTGAAAGAEIGRLFRNYVVHGNDPMPIYCEPDLKPMCRFYAVSKMLLVLIQGLVLVSLTEEDVIVPLSQSWDRERERASWLLRNLHLKDENWLGLDPEAERGRISQWRADSG